MAIYTNPTGSFNATPGDDTIIFNAVPTGGYGFVATIDAIGGHDSVSVQVASDAQMIFRVSDMFDGATFHTTTQFSPYGPQAVVYDVESVDFRGGTSNDTFRLVLGPSTSGLTVQMDGDAGQDLLEFNWSKLTTDISFVVSGDNITSSFGTFSNFETFEIRAGDGNDTITTSAGADNIQTGSGVDTVTAGAGNDYIYSNSTGGTVDGGDGYDHYTGDFGASAIGLNVTIDDTITISNGIVVANVETVSLGGSSGNDQFTVTRAQGVNSLSGGGGHDTLIYQAPSNSSPQIVVEGYFDGTQQLHGYVGEMWFEEFESLAITGSQFADEFELLNVSIHSAVSFAGEGGTDLLTADWTPSADAISFIVAADGAITSNAGQFTSLESFALTGGSGADTFVTSSANDNLAGGEGSDRLDAGAGDDILTAASYAADDGAADVLIGGIGNDHMSAGYGDTVDGGSGTDDLFYTAAGATSGITANFLELTSGGTISIGGATLAGVETITGITGSNFADDIIAGAVSAGGGGIEIDGLAGDDRLTGSTGGDAIHGGDGNDTLIGGLGADSLVDDSGFDTFAGTAAGLNGDRISGLSVGDRILIADATLAGFTYSFDGATLTYTGGSLYMSEVPGRLVASAAPEGGVQLTVEAIPLGTVDDIADVLASGYWDGDSHHFNVTQGGTITVNLTALTLDGQYLAREALAVWSDVIGVTFAEVTSGGQVSFDDDEAGAFSSAQWSNGIMSAAHVNISADWLGWYGAGLNSFSFETYVHEVGHALGLGHPGNYNESASYFADALFANDGLPMSVMSYFDQQTNKYFADQNFTYHHVVTPMMADIVAMSMLYGLSTTTRTGDTVYGFNSNAGRAQFDASQYQGVAYTIVDSGGVDTLDFSGATGTQLINLNAETFSNVLGFVGNLAIARGVVLENAVGGIASDQIIGNAVGNVLTGGGGYDMLAGGSGDDTLIGGEGADILDGGAGNDRIVYDAADTASQVTGGADNDVLVVAGAAPTGFNLIAQGFEAAEVTQMGQGGDIASTVDTYNGNWQVVEATTNYANGSRVTVSADPADVYDTRQVWYSYDALGRLANVDNIYDDGTRLHVNLDEDSSKEWSQDWFAYDAQGRLDSEDVLYDGGSHTFVNFDQDDSRSWAQDWFNYDALGRLDSEDVVGDDGSHIFINLDQDDSQAWSSAWFSYDAQGRLDTQDVVNDDASHTFTNYDQAGTEAFQLTAMVYNSGGALTQQVVLWDDGSTSYTYY